MTLAFRKATSRFRLDSQVVTGKEGRIRGPKVVVRRPYGAGFRHPEAPRRRASLRWRVGAAARPVYLEEPWSVASPRASIR